MACREAAPILTIRLALEAGPEAQFALVADEVRPVSAEPDVKAVPLLWPDDPLHSTV